MGDIRIVMQLHYADQGKFLGRCARYDAAKKADLQLHLSKQAHLLQIYDSMMSSEHISVRNSGHYDVFVSYKHEDAIMYALDHSDHFVVILSKLEYLQSNWDQEMSAFLHEIREGRKAEANFGGLIGCFL